MPLALLLQKTLKAFNTGVKQLDNWNQLVQLEQLLIGRARSAFLVHWFGAPLPLHGAHLRVVISNLTALQSRYQAIRAANSQAGGPNLLKPLAGLSGLLAGTLLSPLASIGLSAGGIEYGWSHKDERGHRNWLVIIAGLINILTFGTLIPILGLFGMVGGTGAALLIGSGAAPSESVLNAYLLLGAAAQMLLALNDLLGQLLGPRNEIRNPLLLHLLELADKFAALLPLLMAGFALLITRISGVLVPLASQLVLLNEVIEKMSDLISEVIDDLLKQFDALTKGDSPFMLLVSVMNLSTALLKVLEKDTRALLQHTLEPNVIGVIIWLRDQYLPLDVLFKERLTEVWQAYRKRLDSLFTPFKEDVKKSIAQVFKQHALAPALYEHLSIAHHLLEPPPSSGPPSKTTLLLGKAYGALSALIARLREPSKGPSVFGRISDFLGAPVPQTEALEKQVDAINQQLSEGFLSFDSDTINKVADAIDAQREQLGLHYTLSEKAWRSVVNMEQPIDVFKNERVQKGKSLKQALRDAHPEEIQYRTMIFTIVHKVLSPYLDEYIAQLAHIFQQVDEYIYTPGGPGKHKPAPKKDYPVLDLKESSRLQPIIRRLHITAEQGEEVDVRAWGDNLQKALQVQLYVVPAET